MKFMQTLLSLFALFATVAFVFVSICGAVVPCGSRLRAELLAFPAIAVAISQLIGQWRASHGVAKQPTDH
jgi:hypothetical protein